MPQLMNTRKHRLLAIRLAIIRIAKRIPINRGRVAQLKRLDKLLEQSAALLNSQEREPPPETEVKIHSLTYSYAFIGISSSSVTSLIIRLFGFRRESRDLVDRIQASTRYTPALSSGPVGYICSDSRWGRAGDTLIASDLPSNIEYICLHYFKATPSYTVISLQCFFREGGTDLINSSINSAKPAAIPFFSIRQLLFGRRFQCSADYEPHPIRDSLHSTFAEIGNDLDKWLKRRASSIRYATAKSIVPTLTVSTATPTCSTSMSKWIQENKSWLNNYGINGWHHLQYIGSDSVAGIEECTTNGWEIHFTLLSRKNALLSGQTNANKPDPVEYKPNYCLPLSFFSGSFSLLHTCAESFERNHSEDLILSDKHRLLSPSRERLVSTLHAQMENMRMISHDLISRQQMIAHFCADLHELKLDENIAESLLSALLKGLQSDAADIYEGHKNIVSRISDSVALKNIYSSASLQRTANALALFSVFLAIVQIAPTACLFINKLPRVEASVFSESVCRYWLEQEAK
jgi:hypothetical protein